MAGSLPLSTEQRCDRGAINAVYGLRTRRIVALTGEFLILYFNDAKTLPYSRKHNKGAVII